MDCKNTVKLSGQVEKSPCCNAKPTTKPNGRSMGSLSIYCSKCGKELEEFFAYLQRKQ